MATVHAIVCISLMVIYLCYYYAAYQEHQFWLNIAVETGADTGVLALSNVMDRVYNQGYLVVMLLIVVWFNSAPFLWTLISSHFEMYQLNVRCAVYQAFWSAFAAAIKISGIYIDGSPLLGKRNDLALSVVSDMAMNWSFAIIFDLLQRRIRKPGMRVVLWAVLFLAISQIRLEVLVRSRIAETNPYLDDLQFVKQAGYCAKNVRVLKNTPKESAEFIRSASSMAVILKGKITNRPKEQVEAVIAHELGHWRHGHNFIDLGIDAVFKIVSVRIAQTMFGHLCIFPAMDLTDASSSIAYTMSMFLTSVARSAVEPLHLYMKRRFEFSADSFADELGYSEALSKYLTVTGTHPDLVGTWIYKIMFQTHPPAAERVSRLCKSI